MYLINRFSGENKLGLFAFDGNHNDHWYGIGNFCGWYGAEYYKNVRLIASFEFDADIHKTWNDLSIPHYNFVECDTFLDEVMIYSVCCEKEIKAETDAEARQIFKEKWFIKDNPPPPPPQEKIIHYKWE